MHKPARHYRTTKLALNVVILGNKYSQADLDLIWKVHGKKGELCIRHMASFSGSKDVLSYINDCVSAIYLTSGVDEELVQSLKDSNIRFGILKGDDTLWYNHADQGRVLSLDDIIMALDTY